MKKLASALPSEEKLHNKNYLYANDVVPHLPVFAVTVILHCRTIKKWQNVIESSSKIILKYKYLSIVMKFKIQTFLRSWIKSKFRCFGYKSGIDSVSNGLADPGILKLYPMEKWRNFTFEICWGLRRHEWRFLIRKSSLFYICTKISRNRNTAILVPWHWRRVQNPQTWFFWNIQLLENLVRMKHSNIGTFGTFFIFFHLLQYFGWRRTMFDHEQAKQFKTRFSFYIYQICSAKSLYTYISVA